MKMKTIKTVWLICLLSFFTVQINAQKFQLGKVSIEELQEKSHPLEPDAEAAVLYENGRTYFEFSENTGFGLITEVEIRIKIYSNKGLDWANRIVPYYVGQTPHERVDFSDAYTYNLVNGKIEKTKLKREGEFDEKINRYYNQKKITMPAVKEGSVIEYKYVIKSPFISTFTPWSFQTMIPVNHSVFETKIPEYFTYNLNMRGSVSPQVDRKTIRKTVNWTTRTRTDDMILASSFNKEKLEYTENSTIYTMSAMPSLKQEDFVSNINNYTATLEHELSMIAYPNSPIEHFATSWEEVVKKIYESPDFGAELSRTGYFEDVINPIKAASKNDAEKVAKIFSLVQNSMNWNGYYGYQCQDGVRRAFKDKTGNIGEINLMLTAMLRHAGLNANPVLTSTRDNGISYFPNRRAYNYVVVAVETADGYYLLDATSKHSQPNLLPIRTLNWVGRLIRKDGTSMAVNLMPSAPSKEVVTVLASIDGTGKMEGKLRDQYHDYTAMQFRDRFRNAAREGYLEKLEQNYGGIEIDDYTSVDDDLYKPVVESFSFVHNAAADVVSDKVYFSPMMFLGYSENPFKQEKREYPVDFIFPRQDKYTITIKVPDGYAVESIPAATSVAMDKNLGRFSFNITSVGNSIQLASALDINQAIITADDYESLKSFFKLVVEKQQEKIVLKKI